MNLLRQARILVVDDREDHGQCIAAALWRCGLSVLFIRYDEKTLLEGNSSTQQGVRLIFMDINLSGGTIGDSGTAFAQVQMAVQSLLSANNGPWALVTWSSHDDKAEALFAHLRQRLPESLRPISLGRLNKEKLLAPDLGDGPLVELQQEISNRLGEIGPLVCLLGWEGHVYEAASSVIDLLGATAEKLAADPEGSSLSISLVCLLRELAAAEGGRAAVSAADVAPYLYRVLSSLLADRLESTTSTAFCQDLAVAGRSPSIPQDWRRKINSMMHLDPMAVSHPVPGAIYVPDDPWSVPGLSTDLIPKKDIQGFIADHFLNIHPSISGTDLAIVCRLALLDVTPPCDHSQQNALWRRHILGCRVPTSFLHLICCKKAPPTKARDSCNPKSPNLWLTPEMVDATGEFVLLLNANLWITLPESGIVAALGYPIARLRDQLMADVIGWLGRHITRRGHVALRAP